MHPHQLRPQVILTLPDQGDTWADLTDPHRPLIMGGEHFGARPLRGAVDAIVSAAPTC